MKVIVPQTALPCGCVRVRLIVMIFRFVVIVDADDRSCEGGDLTESDEDGLVDLSLRSEPRADVKEREPAQREDSGDEELYELRVFHIRYLFSGFGGVPLFTEKQPLNLKTFNYDSWHIFLKSGAKVQQKNEATKFRGSVFK